MQRERGRTYAASTREITRRGILAVSRFHGNSIHLPEKSDLLFTSKKLTLYEVRRNIFDILKLVRSRRGHLVL